MLEDAVAAQPRNADAWVNLGLTRSATGDVAGARAAFLRTLEIAPSYDDAKVGLARLAYRAGDGREAQVWLDRVGAAHARDPDVVALRSALSQVGHDVNWRLDAGAAYSDLSRSLPAWREGSASIARRQGRDTFGAGLEWARRFDLSDVYGEARYSRGGPHGYWGLSLGAATEHIFKPKASLRLEGATAEDQDWGLNGAVTFARYDAGPVRKADLRVSRKVSEDARISAQGVVVKDETGQVRAGYGLGAKLRVSNKSDLSLGWSDAPESSEGFTVDVRTVSVGLSAEVAPGLQIRTGVARENRKAFDRTEVSLGLARWF